MFTGIIESVGKIVSKQPYGQGVVLKIDTGLDLSGDAIGESVAVDGVCLTITKMKGSVFSAHASAETISRSTLGDIRPGAKVNIERCKDCLSRMRMGLDLLHKDSHVFTAFRFANKTMWDQRIHSLWAA